MGERAPYSRVYWQIRSDDRLSSVYPNDANLAAWLRLLLAADMAYPAPADLPRNVKAASVTALEAAGVIARLPGGLFTFHGLDTERGRRRDLATTRRSPDGTPTVTGRYPDGDLAEPSLAEPSTSRAEAARADVDPADTYWSVTGRYPQDKSLSWIDDLAGRFGSDASSKAIAACHAEDGTVGTLLGRVKDRLTRDARQLDRAERADESARLKEKRASVGHVIQDHNWGRHSEPNPDCRYCREGAA